MVFHCGFNNAFPLITFNIKHLFMPLLAICMSLVKCLHISHFYELFISFYLSICLLFIFLIKVFYQVYDLLIFPFSLWLVMSAMYFEEQFPFWRASLVGQLVKNPPAMRETWVWSLGWEDPLEKGKATYSRILTWRVLWTVYSQTQLSDFNFSLHTSILEKFHLLVCSFILMDNLFGVICEKYLPNPRLQRIIFSLKF